MADNEQKARQLVAEAEKKEKSSQGFFSSLFGSSSKTEDACELYVRAANSFKMSKKWADAGQCFCKAAEIQIKLQSKHQAASEYVNAATCYKKGDPNEAVNCLLKAIEIFTDMGRFSIAAKHHISVAEVYETELVDIDKAIVNYEQAADYFKGEESNSSANKCYLKVAQYSAQLENYEKAIELYEQTAISCMDNQLLKYSAKDHFFKAALCHLCVDLLNGQQALQKYTEMFPQFADARECKLLTKIMEAMEEENADMFTDSVKEFDTISRLDQWTTTMLLRIKKNINDEDLR